MKKVFLDANIVLDFLDQKRPYHKASTEAIRFITESGWRPVITEDLLTTIYYIFKDKNKLLGFFDVILEDWEIVSFGRKRLGEAVSICKKDPSRDFEDVIQSLSARDSGCNLIVSNDANFHDCGVKIEGSPDFIESGTKTRIS